MDGEISDVEAAEDRIMAVDLLDFVTNCKRGRQTSFGEALRPTLGVRSRVLDDEASARLRRAIAGLVPRVSRDRAAVRRPQHRKRL